MKRFTWLKVFTSPFKIPKLRLYMGKTAIGVPYFFPRKWVKCRDKPGYMKPVPLTIGFSYCDLGWKTKWTETDLRYEWSPVLSFVFFGYQIAMWPEVQHQDHYWTSWLYYELFTDKTKTKEERIAQCRIGYPNIWLVSKLGVEGQERVDYYPLILKEKYV